MEEKMVETIISDMDNGIDTSIPVSRLFNCDFRELLKRLPDKSVDLVICDVPYGKNYISHHRKNTKELCRKIEGDSSESESLDSWVPEFISETFRVMKDNTDIYIFCSWDTYPFWFFSIGTKFNMRSLIVGIKPESKGMGDLEASYKHNYELVIHAQKGRKKLNNIGKTERHSAVVDIPLAHPDVNDYVHPTQKNVDFCRFLIQKSSNKGDVVADFFAGSGTTLVAAKIEERKYLGSEIDREYYGVAVKRLDNVPQKLTVFSYKKVE